MQGGFLLGRVMVRIYNNSTVAFSFSYMFLQSFRNDIIIDTNMQHSYVISGLTFLTCGESRWYPFWVGAGMHPFRDSGSPLLKWPLVVGLPTGEHHFITVSVHTI